MTPGYLCLSCFTCTAYCAISNNTFEVNLIKFMEMIMYDLILFILKYTIRILNVSSEFMFQNRVVVNQCKLTVGGETMLNNLWMTWPVMGLSRGGCVTSLPSGGCHSPVIV